MATILVIDDDPYVRATIGILLEGRRFGVFLAPDGATGIYLLNSIQFDVAIVDIFMPGLDGLATIRKLKARNPRIPIIAMSARAFTRRTGDSPDFLGMAVRLGAASALQKPFRPGELFDAIARCLEPRGPALPAARSIPLSDSFERRSEASL